MGELLLVVLICGVVAWIIYQFPIPQPFQAIAIGILIIIVLVALFGLFGIGPGIRFNLR